MTEQIEDAIKRYGSQIDDLLREVIPPGQSDCLSEPIWHHLSTGGKRIRPALCLITCEALGGNPEHALPFAVAVEILHNMFLLHDDIEDGDTMRRDQPTVWVKFGLANGINAGDYLLARAYSCVLKCPVSAEKQLKLLDVFTSTCEKTIQGQALDINARGRENFTTDDYMRLVELKTGGYLAFGMVGGAVVAGAAEGVIEKLWSFGKTMGPAFQIRDDMIDLTAGKGRGGAIGSDIKEGKPSFLYAHTCRVATEAQRQRLRRIMLKPREKTTDADVRWVLKLYEKHGALAAAQARADSLVAQAFKTIDELPLQDADPSRPAKQVFRDIAAFMARRTT